MQFCIKLLIASAGLGIFSRNAVADLGQRKIIIDQIVYEVQPKSPKTGVQNTLLRKDVEAQFSVMIDPVKAAPRLKIPLGPAIQSAVIYFEERKSMFALCQGLRSLNADARYGCAHALGPLIASANESQLVCVIYSSVEFLADDIKSRELRRSGEEIVISRKSCSLCKSNIAAAVHRLEGSTSQPDLIATAKIALMNFEEANENR